MHNITKHAHAQRVTIRLRGDGEAVTLEIRDDGVGFDPGGSFPGHLGLRSMRERVARLGGGLEITSAPGAGTRLVGRIPVRTAATLSAR